MMMQTKKPAANPLMEIAERIREMREIVGYSEAEMAEKTEVSVEQYHSYEQGTVDFPFTFMHKCALAFGVELTDLLEGQSAKLSSYTVTRRGMGPVTASEDGITIQNMAAMFRQKLATPYWVTYQYSKELQSQPIHTTTHAGQEFDLVVKGTLRVRVGEHEEVLHEGDSIFYKSSTPHGMIAVDGQDCVFLAMIMASSEKEQDLSVRTRTLEETPEQQLLCDQFVHGVEKEDGSLERLEFHNEDKFNFAFDIVDGLARREPDKLAMVHVANDMTERRFTFKDMKDASSQAANYFTSLGVKRGDRVMLVLKRHYQFWFAILGLHKLGAIAIPATNQLMEHDFSYRFKAAGVSAIVCTADGDTAHQVDIAEADAGVRFSSAASARAGTTLTRNTACSPGATRARTTRPAATIRCSCSSRPARPVIRRSLFTATNMRWAITLRPGTGTGCNPADCTLRSPRPAGARRSGASCMASGCARVRCSSTTLIGSTPRRSCRCSPNTTSRRSVRRPRCTGC